MSSTTQTSNNLLSPTYTPKRPQSPEKDTLATTSSDSRESRRPSETPEWLLPSYRPTEFRSRSSSVNSRSRSTSGSWDTHYVSAAERKWRKDQEKKSRNAVKKLFSYGFMDGK